MTGHVHKLTECLLPGEADTKLVEELRKLLAQAERGEITAMAWAAFSPNNSAFHGWEGAGGTMFGLGASIMALQVNYALMIYGGAE